MSKIIISIFILSISTLQPAYAAPTQLRQWIAPPECVIDGDILTPEECDQLLHPTPPTTTPPTEGVTVDVSSQKPTSPYWQISSLLVPFTLSSPSSMEGAGIRIVDRSEAQSPSREHLIVSLIILVLILIGTVLLIFTSRRRAASLSKEDMFDKIYGRVSSFWTRKAK